MISYMQAFGDQLQSASIQAIAKHRPNVRAKRVAYMHSCINLTLLFLHYVGFVFVLLVYDKISQSRPI